METSERPWGTYTVLEDAQDHKVKRIEVRPGGRLSYQRHLQRAEHWFVLRGTGKLVLDGVESQVGPGVAIDIPLDTAHRIENPGAEPLVFIEVQHGSYFGEDDIIRYDDIYARQ